jgi:predicted acylesterase/phospholipase RssA
MTARSNRKSFAEARDIPFEHVALVLQGGGALGA